MPTSDHLSLNILVGQIGAWGKEAFPGATPGSIILHLREEIEELERASDMDHYPSEGDIDEVAEELADCFLLLSQIAYKLEIDLADSVVDKLARNKARRWRYDPALGYSKHEEG